MIPSMHNARDGSPPTSCAQIRSGLLRSGFQLWFPEFDLRTPAGERAIFGGLRDFQEHLGGELCVTFPRGIGARFEVHEIDLALMEAALQELSQVAASPRMIVQNHPQLHLTYCLNVHPGERWAANFAAIQQKATGIKERVAPDQWFGLGLRLSARGGAGSRRARRCRATSSISARNSRCIRSRSTVFLTGNSTRRA